MARLNGVRVGRVHLYWGRTQYPPLHTGIFRGKHNKFTEFVTRRGRYVGAGYYPRPEGRA